MKRSIAVLLLSLLAAAPSRASVDFARGSLHRSAHVPAWGGGDSRFTIMLWVYAPGIAGNNSMFAADDGGAFDSFVNIGTAADSPNDPYFITPNGEWHFNQDGSSVANPQQSFDISQGWTFLAATMEEGGASDLYAWQAGVAGNALVHIPMMSAGSAVGGSGTVRVFSLGDESGYDESCACFVGPIYVYDGVVLTEAQIDAQRQHAAPQVRNGLIAFSSFSGSHAITDDESGTADWSAHGTVTLDDANPPVQTAQGKGSVNGGGGSGGGGALDVFGLLTLLGAAVRRRRSPG